MSTKMPKAPMVMPYPLHPRPITMHIRRIQPHTRPTPPEMRRQPRMECVLEPLMKLTSSHLEYTDTKGAYFVSTQRRGLVGTAHLSLNEYADDEETVQWVASVIADLHQSLEQEAAKQEGST